MRRSPAETSNFYERLGIRPSATAKDIKDAYRLRMYHWHPDRHQGRESEATRATQAITEAYHVLKDEVKRAHYDMQRENAESARARARTRTRTRNTGARRGRAESPSGGARTGNAGREQAGRRSHSRTDADAKLADDLAAQWWAAAHAAVAAGETWNLNGLLTRLLVPHLRLERQGPVEALFLEAVAWIKQVQEEMRRAKELEAAAEKARRRAARTAWAQSALYYGVLVTFLLMAWRDGPTSFGWAVSVVALVQFGELVSRTGSFRGAVAWLWTSPHQIATWIRFAIFLPLVVGGIAVGGFVLTELGQRLHALFP